MVHNSIWNFPESLKKLAPDITSDILDITLPISTTDDDSLNWSKSNNGIITFKHVYDYHIYTHNELNWTKFIWKPFILQAKFLISQEIFNNGIATNDKLRKCDFTLVSFFLVCTKSFDTPQRLFLD